MFRSILRCAAAQHSRIASACSTVRTAPRGLGSISRTLAARNFSEVAGADVEGCCANDAVSFIKSNLPENWTPHVGMILGSGMGDVADAIEVEKSFCYSEIPDFPVSSVSGHHGKLILGKLNGLNVACFQGRVHLYEGIEPAQLRVPIYSLRLLGCEQLLVTTAVGSLMPGGVMPGDLVAVSDHINLQAKSPLIGANDPIGPRFVDMSNAYDLDLRRLVQDIGRENNIRIYEGTYAALLGPTFETPAEIRMLRVLGADVVGMSLVGEVALARHCGMKCVAIAVVVNHASAFNDGVSILPSLWPYLTQNLLFESVCFKSLCDFS